MDNNARCVLEYSAGSLMKADNGLNVLEYAGNVIIDANVGWSKPNRALTMIKRSKNGVSSNCDGSMPFSTLKRANKV